MHHHSIYIHEIPYVVFCLFLCYKNLTIYTKTALWIRKFKSLVSEKKNARKKKFYFIPSEYKKVLSANMGMN